jgi:hypothetical protein
LVGRPFEEALFLEIDQLLQAGQCPSGWLDLEQGDTRLTCLIHNSRPFLAGLVEPERFSWVPLVDLVTRARRMEKAVCSLYRADLVMVLLMAVHFRNRPVLQGNTRLVDLTHVLDVLAKEGNDAAMSLERSDSRTLLFLQKGVPARIYFGDPKKDPGVDSVTNRFLLYGFAPHAPVGKVELYNKLNIEPDEDARRSFSELAEEAKPPPTMNLVVSSEDKVVMQRPFMPPYMVIGRDQVCELLLNDLSISREHAKLSWKRGRFVIEDLGSANGTTVNGDRVQKRDTGPGERIGVGIFEVELRPVDQAHDPKATMMMVPDASEKTLYLAGGGQSAPLTSGITIGSTRGVDLKAKGWGVRSVHARIKIEGSGVYRLLCLGSASVLLNGKKTRSAFVKEGDVIRVGRSRFQFISIPTVEPF